MNFWSGLIRKRTANNRVDWIKGIFNFAVVLVEFTVPMKFSAYPRLDGRDRSVD